MCEVIVRGSNKRGVALVLGIALLLSAAGVLWAQQAGDDAAAKIPSIAGVWQEASVLPTRQESLGVFITITQTNGNWKARCSYTIPKAGEVRWEMNGTITADGKIRGKLRFTKAPAKWQLKTQIREGKMSDDGTVITGTAISDHDGHDFKWTRKMEKGPP